VSNGDKTRRYDVLLSSFGSITIVGSCAVDGTTNWRTAVSGRASITTDILNWVLVRTPKQTICSSQDVRESSLLAVSHPPFIWAFQSSSEVAPLLLHPTYCRLNILLNSAMVLSGPVTVCPTVRLSVKIS
jgi:hypothetical protein